MTFWQDTSEPTKPKSRLHQNTIDSLFEPTWNGIWKNVTSIWFPRRLDTSLMVISNDCQYQRINRKIFLWILSQSYSFLSIGKVADTTQHWWYLINLQRCSTTNPSKSRLILQALKKLSSREWSDITTYQIALLATGGQFPTSNSSPLYVTS